MCMCEYLAVEASDVMRLRIEAHIFYSNLEANTRPPHSGIINASFMSEELFFLNSALYHRLALMQYYSMSNRVFFHF